MFRLPALVVAATVAALPVLAQDINGAVKARNGQMALISYNLGLLGAMAKNQMLYDADLAVGAARNVAAAADMSIAALWVDGSDNGAHPTSRANPVIWTDMADFSAKMDALTQAALSAADSVGTGPEAIRPALGAMGGTCKGCHQVYRGPRR